MNAIVAKPFRPAPRTIGVKLTTINQTTIYTAAGANMNEVVEWVHIGNTDSTPRTVTLEWTDSSAAVTYALMTAQIVPANASIRLDLGVMFPPGDALKATASSANTLQLVVAVCEMGRSS